MADSVEKIYSCHDSFPSGVRISGGIVKQLIVTAI